MNGKQHFMIGVSVTASLMLVGLAENSNMMVLSSLVAPIGAMLPDIDHDMTSVGRVRKNIVLVVNKILFVLCIGIIAYGLYLQLVKADIFNCLILCFASSAVLLCTQTNIVRAHLKFFYKHRGIMHSMVVPALLMYIWFKVDIEFIKYICLSLSFGYMSHLFADCFNVRGCPLLFPFTVKEIHVPFIRVPTSSWLCNVVTAVIMLLIIGVGVLHYGGYDNDLFRVSMLVSFNR